MQLWHAAPLNLQPALPVPELVVLVVPAPVPVAVAALVVPAPAPVDALDALDALDAVVEDPAPPPLEPQPSAATITPSVIHPTILTVGHPMTP